MLPQNTKKLQPNSEHTHNVTSTILSIIQPINQRNNQAKSNIGRGIQWSNLVWLVPSPVDLFYTSEQVYSKDLNIVCGTDKLKKLCDEFEDNLLKNGVVIRSNQLKNEPLLWKKSKSCSLSNNRKNHSSSSYNLESVNNVGQTDKLDLKKMHPLRLHQKLWFNEPGRTNNGPLCRCSKHLQHFGIKHKVYAGENPLPLCNPNTNNADKLHHYCITFSPTTNFSVPKPTIIKYNDHEFIFEGFSMFSHSKLNDFPLCKVTRFYTDYEIRYYEDAFPQNFTIRELNLVYNYLFKEILELADFDLQAAGDPEGCPRYHFMPRFVREPPAISKEILPMNEVLKYLLKTAQPLIPQKDLTKILVMPQCDWNNFTDSIKGMIVTCPGMKPCSLRLDQLERNQRNCGKLEFPEIVHRSINQVTYATNTKYQRAWKKCSKLRRRLANKHALSVEDKRQLKLKAIELEDIETKKRLNRYSVVTVSSQNFLKTGIMSDVVQHALMLPVLVSHLRFHQSLDFLEENIKYKFRNRSLLELALTHPSYKNTYGTNPDHIKNSLSNCGIRTVVYGDSKIRYRMTRTKGLTDLIRHMTDFGKTYETESLIAHNERLEFLGDAVVGYIVSWHLFQMFPDLEEGSLAKYKVAIVENKNLAILAKTMHLEDYLLSGHGTELCHSFEWKRAMANCFEALIAALYLDGGIAVADMVLGKALFYGSDDLIGMWVDKYPHPAQQQEPFGDRHHISSFSCFENLTKFEQTVGIEFTHIRLLAQAFTLESIKFNNLNLGSNQTLEFLGGAVLLLVATEHLYKHFPQHREGHLSMLRASLVSNQSLAGISNDLGLAQYAQHSKAELSYEDRADLLKAFIGALFVDQGLNTCKVLYNVCFFTRLQDLIMHQDWLHPKIKLQEYCLSLPTIEGGDPKHPVYKVIKVTGPSNNPIHTVAVYFDDQCLATASASKVRQAKIMAAEEALKNNHGLFTGLNFKRREALTTENHRKRKKTSLDSFKNKKKSKMKKWGF